MSTELPIYQCHKRVEAFKIEKMIVNNFENMVYLSSIDGHKAKVNSDQVMKHNPQLGWYYVEYEGGYQSFSPAAEFEAGYKLLGASSEVEAGDGSRVFLFTAVDGQELIVNAKFLQEAMQAIASSHPEFKIDAFRHLGPIDVIAK